MADENKAPEISAETAALAAVGRGEEAPAVETKTETPQRPDDVPEKFWDAEKGAVNTEALLKSYTELEKLRNQPAKEPTAEEKAAAEEAEKAAKEAAEAAGGIPAELFTSAQTEWAEKGELTAETREKIISSGIPAETLDTYLAGVAALSEALTQSVYTAAGGEEAYTAAVEWARENWPAGQIEKFDAALNDADLMPVMVKALMADYSGANPGEGTKTTANGGSVVNGDVYHDADEFTRDLQAADLKNDTVARKAAVAKLERSKKAGTLKHVTPRTGVSQLIG